MELEGQVLELEVRYLSSYSFITSIDHAVMMMDNGRQGTGNGAQDECCFGTGESRWLKT
jgi:hypothetical protein